jgi:hypothetical protein
VTWRYREFRCDHGYVEGKGCPDCKVAEDRKRRKSVQKHSAHYVPVGYGKEELNARRGCS